MTANPDEPTNAQLARTFLSRRRPYDPAATSMNQLLDNLLEQHCPVTDPPTPEDAPRAMICQIVVGVQQLAGTLSETGIGGIYRMLCEGVRPDKSKTFVEYFFTADDIKSIAVERADLAELARKTARDGSRIVIPGQ